MVLSAAAIFSISDMRGFASPFSMRFRYGRLMPSMRQNVVLFILKRLRSRLTLEPKTYDLHSAEELVWSVVCAGCSLMPNRVPITMSSDVIVRIRFGGILAKMHDVSRFRARLGWENGLGKKSGEGAWLPRRSSMLNGKMLAVASFAFALRTHRDWWTASANCRRTCGRGRILQPIPALRAPCHKRRNSRQCRLHGVA